MELYYVMSFIDRSKVDQMFSIYKDLQLSVIMGNIAAGTATSEHLLLYDLQATEKVVLTAVATRESVKKLFEFAEQKLYIDIPGNGIVLSVPLKSVCSRDTLSLLTEGQTPGGEKPSMKFDYELIIAIISEGHSDEVMDAARSAGATGGTVLHAKGTGHRKTEKFMGISLAKNKDVIYILADSEKKADIMQAIHRDCGGEHPAEAVCFTLPVSAVTGIRNTKPQEIFTEDVSDVQ